MTGRVSKRGVRTPAMITIAWLGVAAGAVAQQTTPANNASTTATTAATSANAASSASATPTAQATTPGVQTPAPRPPFPNRANELMPRWLRIRGEFRERFEGFQGSGFVTDRDDTYYLSRFRFNVTASPNQQLSFQVQAQDARVGLKEVGVTDAAPFFGAFDLRTAFADIGAATGPVTVRAGRQELVYGDQRLVGHVSWLNTARTFDAVKATLRSKPFTLDVFAASVVRIQADEFDKSGNGNRFYGAYGFAPTLIPQSVVEPFFFVRGDENIAAESGGTADLQSETMGARWVGKLPARLDYNIEMALQRGSVGADSINAWAGHWQIRESYPGPQAVKLTAEFNVASGDANPTDGVRGTFDQLYPTPHDKYGLADQVAWKNIKHVRAGIELVPAKKWTLSANYHSFWLMESRDALYAAGGAVSARVLTGAASTHVGQELDAQVTRPITNQLQIAAGIAHIFSGAFLREATPGASFTLPYVMATYVFLADR